MPLSYRMTFYIAGNAALTNAPRLRLPSGRSGGLVRINTMRLSMFAVTFAPKGPSSY